MTALAITDHGNMFGIPQFAGAAKKEGIKPIIGCEFYVAKDRHDRHDKTRYHQVLLAKNEAGYKNLAKLCSLGFTEGYYYKPRIDKGLISAHAEGIIATSCCLASEINRTILKEGEEAAEKIFLEWLKIFGEDYYVELQRHGIPEQDLCNEILLRWSRKYGVKVIATNDVHYIDQRDSTAQDVLLCLQTGKDYDDPNRMRFQNDHFFLRSPDEMKELFKDVPEAIENTGEIVEKIQTPKLERDILLPIYQLPEGFVSEDDYLQHLTYEGARQRYGELTAIVQERIDFELNVIKSMGFAGYFLIVQDFMAAARKLGVAVGPGRGSAAGSVVAYCTGITGIDPIGYDLLFERFLNPERVSMPDIDIDFDDEGRQRVIDYVVEKYGRNQVAQIITFGSMAAKSSIRDVARVLGVPLSQADYMAKLVPDGAGVTLNQAFKEIKELADLKNNLGDPRSKVLQFAETLEGSARHTGIHAAGIIIAPDDLRNHIPVCISKDSDLLVTQYEGYYIEQVGMLKMDFLGLKTLTIIKDAVKLIRKNKGIDIDIEKIPLNDPKTFELYQRGDTVGTFQFESEGMRMYLKELKPTDIEDLIAMNALYRPGPMQFIPNFIQRKHGKEKVEYPHPLLEDILKNTYGIMVYQEQIMQTAQIMAGYTLGGADLLRRAMGKKNKEEMDRQRDVFIKGSVTKHNITEKKAEEIFSVMEKFAMYGFNRSHSAAYSVVAYQTAYLKANYPAEYMAAVLTHNMGQIDKITFFMDECRRQGLQVLGPDINESNLDFDVNTEGRIRFGLGAVKGAGEAAVEAIISERENKGGYKNFFDFSSRVNLRTVNKKTFESLAQAGAFDRFSDIHRGQYFHVPEADGTSLIEKAIRYGNKIKEEQNTAQQSLFGGSSEVQIPHPKIPACEPWSETEKLKREKEVVGFYISGHPLDPYKPEIDNFCTCTLERIEDFKNKEITVAGIVTSVQVRRTRNDKLFLAFTMEDYNGSLELVLFGDDYLKMGHLVVEGTFLYIKGKVQERYNTIGRWELKPISIRLLQDIREKLTRFFLIRLRVDMLDNALVEVLGKIIERYPGHCELRIALYEPEEKIDIEMFSRKFRVNPVNELIANLEELGGISWKMMSDIGAG